MSKFSVHSVPIAPFVVVVKDIGRAVFTDNPGSLTISSLALQVVVNHKKEPLLADPEKCFELLSIEGRKITVEIREDGPLGRFLKNSKE